MDFVEDFVELGVWQIACREVAKITFVITMMLC